MPSTYTRTVRLDVRDYADTIAAELLGLGASVWDGHVPFHQVVPEDRADALTTWLNDLAPELVEVTRNLGSGDVTAVEVARTRGGRTCYVLFDQYDGVVVRASWGSDRALVTLPYEAGRELADLMLNLIDEVEA